MAGESGRLIAGRYLLVKLLGQGGMGFVWQAHDQVLDREVAVKEIVGWGQDVDRGTRALREARAAGRLNHPGIVTVHDLVEAEGRSWLVMELVAGPSLADVLRETGPLPEDRVAEIGLEMVEALRAAHDAGILHRDIKPGNVLLPKGGAVITDFGIATMQGDESLTVTGQVVGTLGYLAPERLRGEQASKASDMWALGATLYAALTGHPPEPGADIVAGGLTPVLEGLLRRDPGDRLAADQATTVIGQTLHSPTVALTSAAAPGMASSPGSPAGGPTLGPAPTATVFVGAPDAVTAGPPSAPARRRPRKGLSWQVMAAAGVFVVVVAVVLTVTLTGGHASGNSSIPAPAIGPSGYPAAHPAVPAGYSVYTDSAQHFSAAVPDSWQATPISGGVQFCAPNGCPAAIAVQQASAGSDPVVDIRNSSAANGNFPGSGFSDYRRLSLRQVNYYAQAAEAEFTAQRQGFGGLRGLGRMFTITNGGKEYYVQETALSAEWQGSLPAFGVFFATFLSQ